MFCDKVGQSVVVSMPKKERCGTKDQLQTRTLNMYIKAEDGF
jgi:hypothetical protein